MVRTSRLLLALLACLGLVVVQQPQALGDPASPSTTSPVMIVLDASGSMNSADAPGPRILAAKRAVEGLVRTLPSSAKVGLMTYGTSTGSSAADKSAGCRDIRLLSPVAPVRRSVLIDAVRAVHARGYTPIGASLAKAAAALPAGPSSIVLVSDGEDTCAPPPPCTVAKGLKQHNRDLVIHTIGFRVNDTARRELQCIAAATGGSYRDASDGPALGAVLHGQVDAGLRPYAVSGTAINGTRTVDEAPTIAPGQYSDGFPAGDAVTKFYAVDLAATETFYVATTMVPPALRGGGVTDELKVVTRLVNANGDRCVSTERESNTVLAGKVDPVTAVLTGVVGGPSWSKRCPTSGRFFVEVTRDNPATTVTRSETVVRLEPPVAQVPRPVTTVPPGLPGPVAEAAARRCIGGASFNSAPLLANGTCTDSLSTGETRYYEVSLGWGQRLSYRVDVAKVPGANHGSGYVRSAVSTPLRQAVTLASTSNSARDFGGPASVSVAGSTLVPIDYGNRDSTRSDIRAYGLAGNYYLSVGMSYPSVDVPYETGLRISVAVSGKSERGPHYLALPAVVIAPDNSKVTASHPAERSVIPAPVSPSTATHAAESTSDGPTVTGWLLICTAVILIALVASRLRRHANRSR